MRLPEYITPTQAQRAAGVAPTTLRYWLQTRPRLTEKDPVGRTMVRTEVFLKVCASRYGAKLNGIGKYSKTLVSPEEIERRLLELEN